MSAAAKRRRPEAVRFDLDQGVTVLLEEAHTIPLVSVVVALRSGSAADPPGKEGLARITARMLRRGARGLDARTIENAIDQLGAEMAVDTTASSVAIHAQVIGRNLEAFLDLFGRLLSEPEFPETELERLKRETIAEIVEARDNDRVVAQKAFQRKLFDGHPYGRTAGGTTASVAAITRDDVRAFYERHFVSGNLVIGFAGDVAAARAPDLAARLVKGLPAGPAIPDSTPPPTIPSGRRLVFVDKPERTQTQILIGTLGTWPHDPDHIPLTVANAVFGGTFTSRLMNEIRSKRGWSYGASARLSIDRQRQAFTMWTFPAATDAGPCIRLELDLLEKFVNEGITPKETAFIKRYLVRSHAFDVDTAAKRLHQALDVELLGLPKDYYAAYVERVLAVTTEAANAAVRERIHPEDLLVVVVGTAGTTFDAVKDAVPNLGFHEVVPFDEES